MSPVTRRRLSRLEKLVTAERKQREPLELAWRRQAARDHATKLVTLILHGDPHIEEPLAVAWDRALDCLELKPVHQIHLPDRLRAVVLPTLPGDNENAKFAGAFCSAPSWLLFFCMARFDGFILGIGLPKNSEPTPDLGQDGLHDMRSWPDLPIGTIGAGRLIPRSHSLDALSSEELIDLHRIIQSGEKNWSRRDRHRYREIMAKVDREQSPKSSLTCTG